MKNDESIITKEKHQGTQFLVEPPLSRREYFAAMAMNGILAGIIYFANAKIRGPGGVRESLSVAKIAVESADTIIAELNKP